MIFSAAFIPPDLYDARHFTPARTHISFLNYNKFPIRNWKSTVAVSAHLRGGIVKSYTRLLEFSVSGASTKADLKHRLHVAFGRDATSPIADNVSKSETLIAYRVPPTFLSFSLVLSFFIASCAVVPRSTQLIAPFRVHRVDAKTVPFNLFIISPTTRMRTPLNPRIASTCIITPPMPARRGDCVSAYIFQLESRFSRKRVARHDCVRGKPRRLYASISNAFVMYGDIAQILKCKP